MRIKNEDYIEKIDDINLYKPLANKVVVKQLTDNTIKRIADVDIHFPTTVRVGKVAARYSVRYGVVVSVPEKFSFRAHGRYQTRWMTEIEVLPGDIVWVEHTGFLNSERITDGKDVYFVVDYQNLVVAKRDLKVIMLNGRVLLEIFEKPQSDILITERKQLSEGVIRYNGSNNKDYKYPKFEDADVEVGDVVCLSPTGYHKLENDIWHAFAPENNLYHAQKKDIIAKKKAT